MTTLLSLVFLLETGLDINSPTGKYILGLLSPLAFSKVLYLVSLWCLSLTFLSQSFRVSCSKMFSPWSQAIAMEMNGVGLTWSSMWQGPAPTPGAYFLLQFVDILLYGLLAYYLDNVLPSKCCHYLHFKVALPQVR